ncbi:MAG: HEPN domain-containing protein, partial [Candidatus Dormiibacterota bacterium]
SSFPDFATDFIAARNGKTHPDPSKRQFSAGEMFNLTRVATYVFEANLMLDLGFAAEACRELLSRNRSIAQFITNCQRRQAE